jgi:hypothetical protein
VVKKRTAPRAAKKKTVKKTAVRTRASVVRPGAGYVTKTGVDLRPLKKAIRLTIEQLSKTKETSRVAGALEGLIAVQQRLTAECEPTMILPHS